MKKVMAGLMIAHVILLLAAGCAARNLEEQTEIVVFMAASLKNSMEEIKSIYEMQNKDIKIIYQSDSSGTLQKQIEEGAECDLFISAALKQMNLLEEGKYVKESSVVQLLKNEIILIKAKGMISKVTGFENVTDAENMALAGADVPAGSYARKIFEKIGNLDEVMTMEVNECGNVTAVLVAVSEGSNEIGVVYKTDAATMSDKVEIVAQADATLLDEHIIYPAGLINNVEADAKRQDAASQFLIFLQSEQAKEVFEQYGFSVK